MDTHEKEKTLFDISDILNDTGAHKKLKILCEWVEAENYELIGCEIEEAILKIILNSIED